MLQELQEQLQLGKKITLKVKIVPNSKQNQIVGFYEDAKAKPGINTKILKIKIAATPEKGKANEELIRFLSEIFNIPQKNITILRGHTSPIKTIQIIP